MVSAGTNIAAAVIVAVMARTSCRKMSDQHRDVGETFIPERTLR